MSLPLVLSGDVLGSLNVYAFAADAFPASSLRTGQLFAEPATVAIVNARRWLRILSQRGRTKLAVIATGIVDEAVARARARAAEE